MPNTDLIQNNNYTRDAELALQLTLGGLIIVFTMVGVRQWLDNEKKGDQTYPGGEYEDRHEEFLTKHGFL